MLAKIQSFLEMESTVNYQPEKDGVISYAPHESSKLLETNLLLKQNLIEIQKIESYIKWNPKWKAICPGESLRVCQSRYFHSCLGFADG